MPYKTTVFGAAVVAAVYVATSSGAQEPRRKPSGPNSIPTKATPSLAVGGKAAAGLPAEAPASARKLEEQAEEAILKKLQEPAEFSFQARPLKEAMDAVAQKHGLSIVINELALKDAGLVVETPVSGTAKGISLEFALNRLLGPKDLAWVVRHEVLEITSKEDAQTFLVTRVYPVADLVTPVLPAPADPKAPLPQPDYESLMDLIKNVIQPDTWKDAGGPATIEASVLTVVVGQTQANHRQLAAVLAGLRMAAKLADRKRPPRQTVIKCFDSRAEKRVAEILNRRLSIDLASASLTEIANTWSKQYGIDVAIDQRGLEEAGVAAAKTTFGLRAKGTSLRSALDLVLREHKLSWIVQDGALLITSREKTQTALSVRVYPVADLIASDGQIVTLLDGTVAPATDDYESLMQTIKNTVLPNSWKDAGGPGTLEFSEYASSLVCLQTREVHEQIEHLLAELRERGTPPKQQPKAATASPAAEQQRRDDEIVLRAYVLSADVAARAKVAEEAAKLVQELVAPDSWKAKDTPVFLRVWPDRLVIRQTAKVHREVQKVLQDLELLLPTGPLQPPAAPPKDD